MGPYCALLQEITGLAQVLHKEEIVRRMDWAESEEACSQTKPLLYTPSSCKAGVFYLCAVMVKGNGEQFIHF